MAGGFFQKLGEASKTFREGKSDSEKAPAAAGKKVQDGGKKKKSKLKRVGSAMKQFLK